MKAFIRKSTYFTIVFVIINLFFTGVAFGQATVSTDLLDYPPGATAIITGSGFQAGETVTLLVVHTGDNPLGTDEEYHQPWTVLADGSGNIETSYYIPTVEEGDALGATFLLTADGQTSLLHAEWIFTDGNVNFKTSGLPNGTTVTVSVNSVTVSGTSPNIGGYGATNGSNVYYSYPISIDVSGTTYNLQSTTPASGFISSNAATNVTATYSTLKLNQNITFNALSDKTYGDVPFAISATASSLLPVSFSILNGPATISGNTITITGAGTVTVRASQAGNGTYLAATNVDQTFTVNKASLAVTAIASDITYGDPAPTVSVTYSGFLGTDNAAGLDNVGFSLGTDYTQYNAVETYNTTIALGTALDNNYNFTPLNTSTFAVGKANLAVTAIASDITYGDPAPTVSVTYSGFLGTDNAAGLDNVGFSLGTDYTQYNAVGTYNTTIALGTALDNNYNFTPLNPSTFAVGKANLTVTAEDKSRQYSDSNPEWTVTYSGFVNNETPTVLGGTLIFTGTGPSSNGSTPPGPSYVITPSGLTSNNYQIFFVNGYLTIINEKACGTYNGTYFKNTSSPTTMTTTVLLSVVVNQEEDGSLIALNNPSNINFAFNLSSFDNNATVSLIGSPVFNSSTSTFTQSANVTIKTGNVSSILDLSWTIGKYFTNIDVSCQDQRSVITVALPGSDFSAGGGFLILGENSGGTKNGLAGTKNNFGYNIKWGKSFSKLTGNFNTIWRQNGIAFQAKSNSAAALIVSKIPNTSPVRYKAQITYTNVSMKQLDCLVNCWSDGNGTVTLTVYDWGEPGSNGSQTVKDQIGFAVKDKNGVLIYSTNTFTQGISDPTAVLNLDGGNIQVRSSVVNGGSSGTTQTARVVTQVKEIPAESVLFNIKAYPNPTANQFTLVIEGGSNEKVEVLVYDLLGRTVKHIENSDNQLINFGEELQADTYIVVVSQGTNRKTLRLIKQ